MSSNLSMSIANLFDVFKIFSSKRQDPLINRALTHFRNREFQQALKVCSAYIEKNKSNPNGYRIRASVYFAMKMYDKTLEDLTLGIQYNPRVYELIMLRALLYHTPLHRFELSLKDCETTIELIKHDIEHVKRLRAHIRDTQLPQLKENLEIIRHFSGANLYHLGQYNETIQILTRLLTDNPDYLISREVRGFAYFRLKNWKKALHDLNVVVEMGTKHPNLYNTRWHIHFKLGNLDQALDDINYVLHAQPENINAYINRGYIYIRMENFEKALDDFNIYIKHNPDSHLGYVNRGYCYYRKNALNKAIKDYDKAISINDTDANLIGNRGYAYFILGNYEQALTDFEKALTLDSELLDKRAGKALTLYKLERVDEAITIWQNLIEEDDNYTDIEWVKNEHNWAQPLTNEAEQIIRAIGGGLIP